jgi:membrane-bound lytic murein transglycosylase B
LYTGGVRGIFIASAVLCLVESAPPVEAALSQDGSKPPFAEWVVALREEALERGIRREIVDEALGSLDEPLAVVIERDRTQAEATQSLEDYIARRVTDRAIRAGRRMLAHHRALLDRVSAAYDVPAPVIVAIWGMESNFGRFSGVRPTIAALATLAWEGRRGRLFRAELFDALEILDRGDIELSRMQGSWAGAMGQPQFMPSSYLRFAADFDGDGRRDIWASPADVFASVANFLKGQGWVAGERWGREVKVPPEAAAHLTAAAPGRDSSCRARREMTGPLALDQWQRAGVQRLDGRALPTASLEASMVSGSARRFLVYRNYDALLGYNCAHAYAVSVGLLSDRIAP